MNAEPVYHSGTGFHRCHLTISEYYFVTEPQVATIQPDEEAASPQNHTVSEQFSEIIHNQNVILSEIRKTNCLLEDISNKM